MHMGSRGGPDDRVAAGTCSLMCLGMEGGRPGARRRQSSFNALFVRPYVCNSTSFISVALVNCAVYMVASDEHLRFQVGK